MKHGLALHRFFWGTLVATFCLCAAYQQSALAQTPGVTLDQFRPTETVNDGFAISRPDDQGHLNWGVQFYLDYANDPLVFESNLGSRDSEIASIVEHHLVGHISGYLSLIDRLVLFAGLSGTFLMDGDDDSQGAPPADGAGIGDPWIGARARLVGENDDFFSLGLQANVTFPVAQAAQDDQAYLGDRMVSVHPELLFELRPSIVRVTANVGARVRENAVLTPTLEVGDELTYGLGVTVPIIERLDAHAELYGSLGFQDFANRQNSPLESLFGVKFHSKIGVRVGAAVGPGFSRGYGSPDVRAVFTLGYSPEPKEEEEPAKSKEPSDRDGDGIPDDKDKCPDDAEDADGFEDQDGCPDPDNDQDGVPDTEDNCPMEAGTAENNGCPEKEAEPAADPPKAVTVRTEDGDELTLDRIEFETNSDKIKSESEPILEAIRKALEEHPDIKKVRIEGHTDDTGPAPYNRTLSRRRALSVKRWLVERGIAANRLSAFGCGEDHPRADNQSETGRQENRRTEFRILGSGSGGRKCKPAEE